MPGTHQTSKNMKKSWIKNSRQLSVSLFVTTTLVSVPILFFMGFPFWITPLIGIVLGTVATFTKIKRNPHSIKCQNCKWSGSVKHLENNKGLCPSCNHSAFMYPKLTMVHETKDYPSSSFKYTYELRGDRTLSMLLAEENQIWEAPIHQWWDVMPEEKQKAMDEFVKIFGSEKTNEPIQTKPNDQF